MALPGVSAEVTGAFSLVQFGSVTHLKNYLPRFMTLDRRQGSRSSLRKRNAKRQNGSLRRPYK